jgi:hypothetical protein
MRPSVLRLAITAACALFCTLQMSLIGEGDVERSAVVVVVVLSLILGYLFAPAMEYGIKDGNGLRPSRWRFVWAAACGVPLGVAFTYIARLLGGGDVDASELLWTILSFGLFAYLNYPRYPNEPAAGGER